jgi:PAS domain S-box-containing protein
MHMIFRRDLPWILLILLVSVGTVALTVLSLSLGIHEVFPYLYILPIIMVSYLFPKRGVLFSLGLGGVYMGLVYMFGVFDLVLITISTAWFYVIVSLGVVMSSLSEGLMREERKYHGIFENSQTGLFTVDSRTQRLVEVNQQCAHMLQYPLQDLLEAPLSLIWPEDQEREYVFSRISDTFHTGDVEVRLRTSQGEMRWALLTAARISENRIACSIIDITERKQIESALIDSEIKFRNLVEKSLAGVFVVQDGIFQYVNPRYAEIHEYRPEELIGIKGPRDLIVEEDWPSIRKLLQEDLPGTHNFIHYACCEVTKGAESINVEVLGSRTIFQGRPAFMGTLLDVTDQREAEHALRQANSKLNLLSSITRHDILNHLTAIQGYIGLAMESTKDDTVNTFLKNANLVTGKTQSLLQFTRDYQNMGIQDPEWQNLLEIILRSSPVITSPHLTQQVHVEGLEIYADKLLEKVFYNLMDNTLRHGEHVTEIRIHYNEEESGLILYYEDNGKGVPSFEKDLIFKRGYGKNTGFGLFLIHEILAITGITIQETGEFGKGACFEIRIPRGNYRIRSPETVAAVGKSRV